MTNIIPQRMTAQSEDEFVVFLIGMRINKFWKPHKWMPIAAAMGKMTKELSQTPNSDLLHAESWGGRTTIMVQYWRSFEALEAYAKNSDQVHLPEWANFNKLMRNNDDVGIWHETYTVKPGAFECVYNNMPAFGLAKATTSVPATGMLKNAKGRLSVKEELA